MIAKERVRTLARVLVAGAAAVAGVGIVAEAQQAARPTAKPAAPANAPVLKPVAIPVNPTDAVAKINGEPISRQNLADECVARKGKEILETLIARKLIEQAVRAKKLEVTAAEVDAEIDRVANSFSGLGREAWLRSLDKERGISPEQYARDIIYPALALRKLAAPLVQVTEQDIKDAFDAQYGEKLRCRIIMVDKLRAAQEIWEELKKNPGGFEKIAQEKSMDQATRSIGGLLAEPITRHAHPRPVSDAAFFQLVDGDPDDKNPAHKPKDGDFTGPIQVTETSWIIFRRESIIPANPGADLNIPAIRQQLQEMMYEAKLKAKMGEVYQDLFRASEIDNVLTGQTKLANEEQHPEHTADGAVKLMSNPPAETTQAPAARQAATAAGAPTPAKLPTGSRPPVGVPAESARSIDQIRNNLKASKP